MAWAFPGVVMREQLRRFADMLRRTIACVYFQNRGLGYTLS